MLRKLLNLNRPFRNKHFNYVSIELRGYEVLHACDVMARVDETKVIVSLTPALSKEIYKLKEDLKFAVLSPRYEGVNFFPSWFQKTMTVNLLIADADGTLENGPWRILDIGDISA